MLVVMYLLCQLIFTLNPFSKVCHILINFASYLPTPEPYLHVSMYRLSIFLSQFWMLALYSMHTTKVFLYIRNILSSYSYLPFNPLRVRTWYITTSPCFPHSLHVLAVRLSVRLSNGVLNKYGRFRTLQAHSPFCEQNFRCKILCTSFHPFYL